MEVNADVPVEMDGRSDVDTAVDGRGNTASLEGQLGCAVRVSVPAWSPAPQPQSCSVHLVRGGCQGEEDPAHRGQANP